VVIGRAVSGLTLSACPDPTAPGVLIGRLLVRTCEAPVAELISVRAGRDDTAPTAVASLRVDAAKVALGERGSLWWDDGHRTAICEWWSARATPGGSRTWAEGHAGRAPPGTP